jgi:phosphohistidine phosphatase
MRLYLLRHAEAAPYQADDFSRRLTPTGVNEAGRVGEFLAAHSIQPEVILTSPVVRARETADIAASSISADVMPVSWLACGMSPDTALDELKDYSRLKSLMLVGHEPDFSALIASLLGLHDSGAIDVTKASLTAIDLLRPFPGQGILRYFLPVKLL